MGTVPTIGTRTAGAVYTAAQANEIKTLVDFMNNAPKAYATDTAGFSVPNNADTVLPLPGELFDVVQSGDTQSHDTVTNNSRITIRTAGKYDLIAVASFSSNATGLRRVTIRLNGTTTITQATISAVSGASTTVAAGPVPYPLVVGDYIEVQVFQNSGGALSLNAASPGPSILAVKWVGI